MYQNVLQVFHDVLLCLTMFLRWLVSRATIGIVASATARPTIAAGIGNNSHKSAMIGTEISDCQYRGESDAMLSSILNGDWSNSVPGRQFLKGCTAQKRSVRTLFATAQQPNSRDICLAGNPPQLPAFAATSSSCHNLWQLSRIHTHNGTQSKNQKPSKTGDTVCYSVPDKQKHRTIPSKRCNNCISTLVVQLVANTSKRHQKC